MFLWGKVDELKFGNHILLNGLQVPVYIQKIKYNMLFDVSLIKSLSSVLLICVQLDYFLFLCIPVEVCCFLAGL